MTPGESEPQAEAASVMTPEESAGSSEETSAASGDEGPMENGPPEFRPPVLADPVAVLKVLHKALESFPLLAPFALLAGWLTVSAYARALGVQPGDLGVGLTELLVLAAINLVVGLVLTVGYWMVLRGGARARMLGPLMVFTGATLLFSSLSKVGVVVGVMTAALAITFGWVSRRRSATMGHLAAGEPMSVLDFLRSLGGLAFILVTLVSLQGWAAHNGGSALRRGGERDLPLALTVVLPADDGTLDPDSDCVVRVAPRVYVYGGRVRVLAEVPTRFTVGCPND